MRTRRRGIFALSHAAVLRHAVSDSPVCHATPGPRHARPASTSHTRFPLLLKMARGSALLLGWLLLATLSATLALGMPAKEKRGWTLNSAGYLLGPHAIDNHRSFSDKHGLTGKRELQLEVEEGRPGSIDGPLPESNIVRTIMEFLTFLHLKEAGALDSLPGLPLAASSEDLEQS
ncbi:galanin peptides isoform X2 [Microtus pennsylvanicus]|uniref:galanin peptides isoform X2 n=1 Tax=Microtus pennsylvanicus TaxID=10058 RepID=UPI003F6C4931